MSVTERVINNLNVAKLMLCNRQMLMPEMCVRIGQAITSAIGLLKAQEPVEPKRVNRYIDFDGDGHPYTPETYDCGVCGNELPWKANYCPACGRPVKWG